MLRLSYNSIFVNSRDQQHCFRYIPVGLLERLPQRINERPPPYFGRNDLETMMASNKYEDWIKIR